MPADSLVSLIQLAVKTGRYTRGDALIPSIQNRQALVVVQSDGCGANRAKKIKDKCSFYGVPLVILPALRFNAISSRIAGAIAVTDPGFAGRIRTLAEQENLLQVLPDTSERSKQPL